MNFFSKVLKHKVLLSSALLVLILLGIIVPRIASATFEDTSWWEYLIPGYNVGVLVANTAEEVGSAVVDAILATTLSAFILFEAIISVAIFGTLSSLAGALLLYIITLNADPSWSFTHFTNPVIAIGWPAVRDLANMVIVLGFVIIGIATALRIKTYEAKQLLPKLIIAALLVNFSLLLCGIFIDGSNMITTAFLKGGGFLEKSVTGVLADQITTLWKTASFTDPTQIVPLISISVGITFFDIISMVVFFLFFFLFLFRYIFLWILVVFSPLAFVLYVFPFTKKFFDMWWHNFLQWCIIGIPGAFFLYLADKLTAGLAITATSTNTTSAATTNAAAQSTGGSMMGYLVPALFLLAGFLYSLQSSAIGAGVAVAAFKKTGGKLIGAGMELGGRTKAGRAMREKLTSVGAKLAETTGFAKQGYAGEVEAKHKSEAKTRLENQRNSSDAGSRQAYENAVRHGSGTEGAAAVALASEKGDFNRILGGSSIDEQKARVAIATAHGYQKSDFVKANPNLADTPKEIREATARTAPSKAAEWTPNIVTPEVASGITSNQVTEIGKHGSDELIDQVKAYKYDPAKKLSAQSPEWIRAQLSIKKSTAFGTTERAKAEANFAKTQKQLASDAKFA